MTQRMLTTFGIEEETMLVDPATLRPMDAAAVHGLLGDRGPVAPYLSKEYLASQVEFSSPVYRSLDDAMLGLEEFRGAMVEACARVGGLAWNAGVPFDAAAGRPAVTRSDRYETIARRFGAVADDHQINALHIHVGVPSRADGVRVLNAVRPWMPVLLALGGNSPYWRARDTGFASWRSILMARWTTSGCPPEFADAHDYTERLARLVGVGGTADAATVAWNLRLSETLPTVEFRVFDAQLESWHSVLIAAICRALVSAALAHPERAAAVHPELLEASLWHAARDGLGGRLVHPVEGALEPAGDVVAALRSRIDGALRDSGDAAFVDDGLRRLRHEGTGAMRQRAAFQRAGLVGLRGLAGGANSPQ